MSPRRCLHVLSMESQKHINQIIMDIHSSIMDMHNSIMDIHNSIMDIHHDYGYLWLRRIMDIHNWTMVSIIEL